MAQSPDWQQFLEAGMHFTAMTRAEAQRRARELVREGQLAQERVQTFVEDLLETSRQRADEFVDAVRHEVERQLKLLGVSSRLPRRRPLKAAKSAKKTSKKTSKKSAKSTKKKPATKSAKQASAAGSKKSTAKKSSNRKATAKKATKKSTQQAAASATKQSP